jgi:thioredoxin-related protein
MNVMKKFTIGLVAVCALLRAGAEESQWLTDLPKAQTEAKKENKLVFIDFNGSDWCLPCMELKKVLSTPEFTDYAKTSLVLVDIDFPQKKEQSEELKKTNAALSENYKIEGFPTVVVLSSRGDELSRDIGFGKSAKELIGELEKLKKKTDAKPQIVPAS